MRYQIQTTELAKRLLLWLSGTAAVVLLFFTHSKFSLLVCLALSAVLLCRCLRGGRIRFPAPGIGNGTVVLLVLTVLLRRFLYSWGTDWAMTMLAERMQLTTLALVVPIALLGCALAAPFLLYAVADICGYVQEHCGTQWEAVRASCENWSLRKSVLVLSAIFAAALLPLFRANIPYNDDIWRIHTGITGWADPLARYLSEFLSHYLFCGAYTTDLSPVSQMLALAVVALSGVLAIRIFKGKAVSLWDLLAMVPLCLNPYFLSCLSYKFDAPYMALSVLASVVPLLFSGKSRGVYCLSVFFGMLAVCMTYQAASGIFPIAVLLLAFQRWCRKEEPGKQTLQFVAYSAAAYLAAYGIYAKFLMNRVETYVDNGIATPAGILENYRSYIQLVFSDFNAEWLLVIAALVLWYGITAVLVSKQRKWLTACVGAGTVVLAALLSFGLYPALKQPLMMRMYGVGAFVAFLSIGNMGVGEQRLPTRALTVILAWMMVAFSLTYGNAAAEQQDYENFRREEILCDLADLPEFYQNTGEPLQVQLVGSAGYAPALLGKLEKYPGLSRLLPVHFEGGRYWGIYKFSQSYGIQRTAYVSMDALSGETCTDWPLLHESFYHAIYYRDGVFAIVIK